MRVLFCDPAATATLAECLALFIALSAICRLAIGIWIVSEFREEEIFERLRELIISEAFICNAVSLIVELLLWLLLANPQVGPGGSRIFQLSIPLFLGGLEQTYFFVRNARSSRSIASQSFYIMFIELILFFLFQGKGSEVAYRYFRWTVIALLFLQVIINAVLPRLEVCLDSLLGGIYIWMLLLSLFYSGGLITGFVGARIKRR